MTDQRKKVLIVDDEPNIIMSIDFLIRKAGYELFIARNGQEALDLAFEEQPDLMVLDIMMPDIDGYEVCRKVKADQQLNDMYIIFLSAKSKQEDIDKGLALGAEKYITKPFSTKYLMNEIKLLLE